MVTRKIFARWFGPAPGSAGTAHVLGCRKYSKTTEIVEKWEAMSTQGRRARDTTT